MEKAKPSNTTAIMIKSANAARLAVPAFNIPYLPIMKPVIEAIVDTNSFGLIEVARLEWIKFESRSPQAVMEEYMKWHNPEHTQIHLDHVPVIDEDGKHVDYMAIIQEALELGYQSVMVDGSRLALIENIEATKNVTELAHQYGAVCEAELGAVLGHESGSLPPYEELFASGKGFTDVDEAVRFVKETGCDWLSVAIGNIHGNISEAKRNAKKVQAKLDIDHLEKLSRATGIPLVLHGGSGVQQEFVLQAIAKGITKINIGTEIRQTYEEAYKATGDIENAQRAVYDRACWIISDYLYIKNSKTKLSGYLR
jgi:ketose-bisphosphate aldolase